MMRILDVVIRFIVGGLFIFSGLIKINDPIGTEIKLKEYFGVFAADFGSFFELFIPIALPIGMVLIVLEIVLGVAVFINYNMKKTSWMLLLLILFFSFLTFYSAYFDKVTDCGCFGDAIKLTPWESFFKDMVLLVFIAHLFFYRDKYQPLLRTRTGHAVILVTTILSFYLGVFAVRHLPFIDFRAYKIGNNIPEQMIPSEQPIIEYVFEKNGEEVLSESFLTKENGYTYKDSRVLNAEATVPKITDYNVIDLEGNDVTEQTYEGVKLLLIINDVTKTKEENLGNIRTLVNDIDGKIETMILTSSAEVIFEPFRHEQQLAASFYFTDATVIKAMIRSNPGIMLLKDGTVLGKWHSNDTPSVGEIVELL
ncbi:MAG: DoxX family protein [Cyclobacteriaceae bacterium]|nr:DoxX family protein [Cyclobacteriaceae bacterium]